MDSKALHKWLRKLSMLVDTKARMNKMCNNSLSNRLSYLSNKGSNPAHSKKRLGLDFLSFGEITFQPLDYPF